MAGDIASRNDLSGGSREFEAKIAAAAPKKHAAAHFLGRLAEI
ncbi:hypothetical protein RFM26_13210 [Mesorhizobium sp. VK23B]|uniref:Uncharacterized protein n=1 Tax=Mesorhizobium dulcispinae TaxID=3072316 RepID=A0ABU4XCE3_9HYPH|nr:MULTISPECIES: hypothetical protein [unclassified Mesorhizobium]MDX8466644.1 hypothetical protein [Mesorhizobium sp. VK23B]MDX8472454.1 hypothetical protein [Mesorhizobium sp. VK23A]